MKEECQKEYESGVPADELKVYYARAMDGTDATKIGRDERSLVAALRRNGFPEEAFINPHTGEVAPIAQADRLVEDNLRLLEESHMLLADLSMQDYTYVGAIFEIAQAVRLRRPVPVVAFIGDSDLENRYYLHHYCDFLCRTIDEAVWYIWRCWSREGVRDQLEEEKEFYDKVAVEPEMLTEKPYADKDSDIARYEEERARLKQELRGYCHGGKVLELGCGTGEWTEVIAEVARSVTCVEASHNMILRAKERLKESKIQPSFIHGDFLDAALALKTYDVIVCYFTLSFLPPPVQRKLLSIMKKRISKDGCFLFGESVQMSTLLSKGLGRQRIQTRRACGKEYTIYKETYAQCRLRKVLDTNSLRVTDSTDGVRWFTFCAARPQEQRRSPWFAP